MQIETTQDDHRIAKLAAVAIALHMVEALVPSPVPGVKPGIANIVTLYVLLRHDFATAAWVSILRVFASSLLLGQFLSPTFALSLSGALLSLATLGLAIRLWLIPHAGVAYLVPIFAVAALIFGLINGLITAKLILQHEPAA
jgi:heptaprenyl diphosphate synthase